MPDHEPRESNHPFVDDDEISLDPLFRILWSYRKPIAAAVGTIVVVFVLAALHTYVTRTVQRASVEFRVPFEGTGRGEYPNGLPFAATDIVSDPVVSQVFSDNALEEYFPFEDFRSAVFVAQVPTIGVQTLSAEYEARIGTQTTPAARASLDEQFRERRRLLQEPRYTLNFVQPPRGAEVPDVLLEKVLNDILADWARYAVDRKHVLEYEVDVPNVNVLRTDLVPGDNSFVALDVLRGRINRIAGSVDELARLPGADMVRVGEQNVSLLDVRVQLEDLLESDLRPLLVQMLSGAGSAERQAIASYLEGRLLQARVDEKEAAERASVVERTLKGNTAFNHTFSVPSQADADEFLQRIITIASSLESIDRPYQQAAMDRIIAAGEAHAKAQKEVADYEEMAGWLTGRNSNALLSRTDPRPAAVESRVAAIRTALTRLLNQIGEIHTEISARNLNGGTSLFSVTTPFSVRIERAAFGRTITAYGLLLLLLTITIVPGACIVHHWARGVARRSNAARARRASAASPSRGGGSGRPDGG